MYNRVSAQDRADLAKQGVYGQTPKAVSLPTVFNAAATPTKAAPKTEVIEVASAPKPINSSSKPTLGTSSPTAAPTKTATAPTKTTTTTVKPATTTASTNKATTTTASPVKANTTVVSVGNKTTIKTTAKSVTTMVKNKAGMPVTIYVDNNEEGQPWSKAKLQKLILEAGQVQTFEKTAVVLFSPTQSEYVELERGTKYAIEYDENRRLDVFEDGRFTTQQAASNTTPANTKVEGNNVAVDIAKQDFVGRWSFNDGENISVSQLNADGTYKDVNPQGGLYGGGTWKIVPTTVSGKNVNTLVFEWTDGGDTMQSTFVYGIVNKNTVGLLMRKFVVNGEAEAMNVQVKMIRK
jgi:hypothetical protein